MSERGHGKQILVNKNFSPFLSLSLSRFKQHNIYFYWWFENRKKHSVLRKFLIQSSIPLFNFFSFSIKIINRLDYFHKISRFILYLKKKKIKFSQQFPLRSSHIAISIIARDIIFAILLSLLAANFHLFEGE